MGCMHGQGQYQHAQSSKQTRLGTDKCMRLQIQHLSVAAFQQERLVRCCPNTYGCRKGVLAYVCANMCLGPH